MTVRTRATHEPWWRTAYEIFEIIVGLVVVGVGLMIGTGVLPLNPAFTRIALMLGCLAYARTLNTVTKG